ncbi:MAG: DUF1307 domain-containing protein [Clostridia bacterium]|nr:DUF1307 domain-containing protein [Clostridia bacterium]
MIKKILIIILALAVVATIFAGCGDDADTTSTSTTTASSTTTTTRKPTTTQPGFDDIFENGDTDYTPPTFTAQETASYAIVLADGTIEVLEYGYEGDLIKEMRQTIYLYVADLTETQKQEMADSMVAAFEEISKLSYVTVATGSDDEYFIMSIECINLDNPTNIKTLMDLHFIQQSQDTSLSMEATDAALISNGYSKQK